MQLKLVLGLCVGLMGVAMAAPLKIGVINLQKIIQKAPEVEKVNQQLAKTFKARKEKLIAAREKLQDQVNKFQRENAVMPEAKRQARGNSLSQERRDLLRKEQDFSDDLELARGQAMKALLDKVKRQVDKLAKREHYDLILQRSNVPYFSAEFDITDKVLHKI